MTSWSRTSPIRQPARTSRSCIGLTTLDLVRSQPARLDRRGRDDSRRLLSSSPSRRWHQTARRTSLPSCRLTAPVASACVREELHMALTDQINGKRIRVLPLKVDDCALPGFLRHRVYCDFTNSEQYREAFQQLVRDLGGEYFIDSSVGVEAHAWHCVLLRWRCQLSYNCTSSAMPAGLYARVLRKARPPSSSVDLVALATSSLRAAAKAAGYPFIGTSRMGVAGPWVPTAERTVPETPCALRCSEPSNCTGAVVECDSSKNACWSS